MKTIIKFLLANFQILNFLVASIIVGVIFMTWYSDNSKSPSIVSDTSVQIDSQKNGQNPDVNLPNLTIEDNRSQLDSSSQTAQQKLAPLQNEDPNLPSNNLAKLSNLTYLGHFPYSEANQDQLVEAGKYYSRLEYLHQETNNVFNQMKVDAQSRGINLVLISGFRTTATQQELFNRQIERQGSKQAAAKLSAPAGHSEHHTGYAVDIGDGNQPNTDLKFSFESTPAYQWLSENASKYGFELSFPRDNVQGISFEPWHWRFIGSQQARKTFQVAREFNS